MKILTLNCGSSSLKYTFFDTAAAATLADGIVERITIGEAFIVHRLAGRAGKPLRREHPCPTHKEAIDLVLATLTGEEAGAISDPGEISAVAHRVVHGGEEFTRSVIIDERVVEVIRRYISLAPLHNPPNVAGIEAARAMLPAVPQIAVFDTAFHYTIPDYAYIYALPYEWYHDLGVRRYGFHGTSHLYVSRRAAALLGKQPSEVNLITLHLGNGASACAVRGGQSVDTSMGLTPLEGLVMGTRSGDVDPAIPFQLPQSIPLALQEIYMLLNRRSGVLGLTGKYADRRDVLAHMEEAASSDDAGAEEPGSPYRCKLALEVECYRLQKYVGAYAAALGRVDAVVFTAGVGENSPKVRALSLRGLEPLGIILEEGKNEAAPRGREVDVSAADSPVKVLVIPTDEERVFIEDTVALLDGAYDLPDRFEYSFQRADYQPRER
ncbi:MAG: acetate kinase [Candidatus Coatesbacteria bacterium]|nr:MAG: acetate kinase [Candidatus Coatesbacteria bacterium]